MADEVKRFFQRIQLRPNVVSGHVSGVSVDPATGRQTYATVAVGGNTIRVRVDPGAPALANGDQVRLEQYGQAASAEYRLAGLEAGARPASGVVGVLDNGTVIGGQSYAGGDLIVGKLDGGNLLAEYATGNLYQRVGAEVYGILYPDGRHLLGHVANSAPDQSNLLLTPTALKLRLGEADLITLDGTEGIRQYAGGIQRSHFRQDGSGWLVGPDKLFWDAFGNLTVTGVEANHIVVRNGSNTIWLNDADDGALNIGGLVKANAPFRVTAAGVMTAASANVTGTVNMAAGSIVLGSTNKLWLNDGNDGALCIGGTTKATAPFKVSASGALSASSGTVGGWTLGASALGAGNLTLDAGNTRIQCGASTSDYVRITPAGIVGVSGTLGTTFNLPSNGSAPTFSSGIINSTIFNIYNASVLRTSETVGNGGANGQGVLINDTGIKGYKANSATPVFHLSAADGSLLCTNANITGTVDANAGHIGALDIDGILTIAAGGEIRQGSGTFGTSWTGFRIWNDSAVGRIAGYSSASPNPQWYADTDGKLKAGGGNVTLDQNGIRLAGSTVDGTWSFSQALDWAIGGSVIATAYAHEQNNSRALHLVVDPKINNAPAYISLESSNTNTLQSASLAFGLGFPGDPLLRVTYNTADIFTVDESGAAAVPNGGLVVGKSFVANEWGENYDTRIEGNSDQNLIFADASTDRVGIGTNAPSQKLDVNGTATMMDACIGSDAQGNRDQAGERSRRYHWVTSAATDDFNYTDSPTNHGWTWATDSGFVTPLSVTVAASRLRMTMNRAADSKSFLYRTPGSVLNQVWGRCVISATMTGMFFGVRIDDGTDNNLFQYVWQVNSSWPTTIKGTVYYRKAGGAAVTLEETVNGLTACYQNPGDYALSLSFTGTKWSNFGIYPVLYDRMGGIRWTAGTGEVMGYNFATPANIRVGLVFRQPLQGSWESGYCDWFHYN